MESEEFSLLSSLTGEFKLEDYVQPHYKESYRVAIDHLVTSGRDAYQEFLKGERIGSFLSEDELLFITTNAQQLVPQNATEEINGPSDNQSSSGTYWPTHSDVQTPDLDMGWPEVMHEMLQTNVDLLFHPPRQNSATIKEVIRKHIQDARQVIKRQEVSALLTPITLFVLLLLYVQNVYMCTFSLNGIFSLNTSFFCRIMRHKGLFSVNPSLLVFGLVIPKQPSQQFKVQWKTLSNLLSDGETHLISWISSYFWICTNIARTIISSSR